MILAFIDLMFMNLVQSAPGSTQSVRGSTQSVPGGTMSVRGSAQSVPGSTHSVPGSTQSVPGSTQSVPGSTHVFCVAVWLVAPEPWAALVRAGNHPDFASGVYVHMASLDLYSSMSGRPSNIM